jgi:predicted transposase YdaD
MKTDKLFYRIFLSQPDLISELVPDIPANCEFDYSAPVIKETELRLDGLLTPISDDLNLPLVFLEAQMQSDLNFYGRFFASIFLYLRQYKIARPWRGLLILRHRGQDLGANSPYQILLDSWVHKLYLEDLIGVKDLKPNLSLLRLLVIPEQEVSDSAKAILDDCNTSAEFRLRLDLVEAILINKFPQLSIEEVRLMLNLREADVTQTRFYQEVFQIGQQEGEIDIVLRQINRRCGQLPIAQQAQIKSLPINSIESLAEALLDFKGMADLEIWMRENVV